MPGKARWAGWFILLLLKLSLYGQPSWQALYEQASQQLENGEWQRALATAELAESEVAEASPEHAKVLHLLASVQLPMGLLDAADASTGRLWQLAGSMPDKDESRLARAGEARCRLLLLFERPEEAIRIAEKALKAAGNVERAVQIAPGLSQAMVLALLEQEDYEIAEEALGKSIAATDNNELDYARLVRARGQLYYLTDRFEQARASLEEAEAILRGAGGLAEAELAEVLNWKGVCYLYQAGYVTARQSLEAARNIWEKIGAVRHPGYAQVLENLGLVYADGFANYARAEDLFRQALEINADWHAESIRSAQSIGNLAILLLSLGDEQQSLRLGRQAESLLKGKGQVRAYATALNNLGRIYARMDSLEQAESLYRQAASLYLSRYGPRTVRHAIFLSNLGAVHELLEDYENAEAEYRQALEIIDQILGQDNPFYATFLNNLAILYDFKGEPDKARVYYRQVEEIDRRVLGPQHPSYIRTLYNIAGFFHYYGDPETLEYYMAANKGQVVLLNQVYATFDEASRLFYLKRAREDFAQFLSFALADTANAVQAAHIQSMLLATKGLALEYSMAPLEEPASSNDTMLNHTLQQWRQASQRLSDAYLMTEQERKEQGIRIDQCQQAVAELEKELSRSINAFRRPPAAPEAQQLQGRLDEKEASIDFFRFEYFDGVALTDSFIYCALVLRSAPADPLLLPLGSEKELLQLLGNSSAGTPSYIQYPQLGHMLYQRVWAPLEARLQGVETVYLCAGGLLHNIAFAALPTRADGKHPLLEQHRIYQYSTFRDMWEKKERFRLASIALFGGAEYSAGAGHALAEPYFLPLPGTREEVDSIHYLLRSGGWSTMAFTGRAASEAELRALAGAASPDILHCATHGFFFGQEKPENTESMQQRLAASPNPLQRSGLALADANDSWAAARLFPAEADGILTALELSTIRFSGTQLAVFSACDTGLGDIEATEGVFGLQRALKKAGIRQLLLSLWKINDATAPAFMGVFYSLLAKGYGIDEAFFETQVRMSRSYPASEWAGFILLH